MSRFTKVSAAAVVLMGAVIILSYLTGGHFGDIALAEVYEELRQAKNVTWTEVAYQRVSSKDGEEVWLEPLTRRCMYKAPGRTRVEVLDPESQVRTIIIVDQVVGVRLRLSCEGKKASVWVAVAPTATSLAGLDAGNGWAVPALAEDTALWTDSFSNLLSALK